MINIFMLWQKRILIVYCTMHLYSINTLTTCMHSTYCMSESRIKSKINKKVQSQIVCIHNVVFEMYFTN